MNYRLNFALMLLVFSVVTYNVCMTYQEMEDINMHGKFQEIGMIETPHDFIVPPRKPGIPESQVASLD